VDEEVGLRIAIDLAEVSESLDTLKANLAHEALHVGLKEGEHVEVAGSAVAEGVLEARQRIVDVIGLRLDVIAAVVIVVRGLDPMVQERDG
jgi:hypothetical protein